MVRFLLTVDHVTRAPLPVEPGSRWAVGGIVAMLVAFAIALVVTSWVSYARADEVGAVLARGEGEGLMRTVFSRVPPRPSVEASTLDQLLADEQSHGLRYVAVVDADGQLTAAGRSLEPGSVGPPRPGAEPPGSPPMQRIGDRWRTMMPRFRRPPPGAGMEPPRGPDDVDGPPDPRRADGPPPPGSAGSPHPHGPPFGQPDASVFVIEFEPIIAAQLRAEAGRALLVGVASAAGLLLAAVLLWRWVRHRERLEARLAQERRLAALGQMSAVLAHEIRNPLASLKGHAQLLVESLEEKSKDRAKADRVVDEAERLERLTQDLLEFVRTGKIERVDCDPTAVMAGAVRAVGGDAIAIEATTAPGRWRLDPERITQVLTNLLQNARQAGPGSPVEAAVANEGGELVYRVRDRGPGVPPNELAMIFEPFHTTRVRGVGLGLAVARRLVELHGGTLDARNHPDGGAEFTVRIPGA